MYILANYVNKKCRHHISAKVQFSRTQPLFIVIFDIYGGGCTYKKIHGRISVSVHVINKTITFVHMIYLLQYLVFMTKQVLSNIAKILCDRYLNRFFLNFEGIKMIPLRGLRRRKMKALQNSLINKEWKL